DRVAAELDDVGVVVVILVVGAVDEAVAVGVGVGDAGAGVGDPEHGLTRVLGGPVAGLAPAVGLDPVVQSVGVLVALVVGEPAVAVEVLVLVLGHRGAAGAVDVE